VVAWNPGPQLSISMADLTDDGYQGFVCVETARVSEPMVSTPEKSAALTTTISVCTRDLRMSELRNVRR